MSDRTLSPQEVKAMLLAVADKIIQSEAILSEADRKLGDGDHGLGMQRGFTAAKAQLEALEPKTVGEALSTTGMALMGSMGGASGAVMGMMFQSGGMALSDCQALDAAALSKFLDAALSGVCSLGGAKPGDKTMVDALSSAKEACQENADKSLSEAMSAAAAGATAGMEKTKDMIATMGRAKTLGEKSLGHPDPGAVSISIMFNAANDFIS